MLQILKDQMKMETLEAEAQLEDRQRISKGRGKDGAEQVTPPSPLSFSPWSYRKCTQDL